MGYEVPVECVRLMFEGVRLNIDCISETSVPCQDLQSGHGLRRAGKGLFEIAAGICKH